MQSSSSGLAPVGFSGTNAIQLKRSGTGGIKWDPCNPAQAGSNRAQAKPCKVQVKRHHVAHMDESKRGNRLELVPAQLPGFGSYDDALTRLRDCFLCHRSLLVVRFDEEDISVYADRGPAIKEQEACVHVACYTWWRHTWYSAILQSYLVAPYMVQCYPSKRRALAFNECRKTWVPFIFTS